MTLKIKTITKNDFIEIVENTNHDKIPNTLIYKYNRLVYFIENQNKRIETLKNKLKKSEQKRKDNILKFKSQYTDKIKLIDEAINELNNFKKNLKLIC